MIGISLGVEVIEEKPIDKRPFEVDILHTRKQLILELGRDNGRQNFDILINGDYLLTATTSISRSEQDATTCDFYQHLNNK